ncbi:tRNA uridine-5-carboxymethylaminomethyl(34) synthesis GTPase MnmE [soil metagenome]
MQIPSAADTICALATPSGAGALAVIRLSGKNAFAIGSALFRTKKGKQKNFESVKPYTLHFGNLMEESEIIDEVLVSVFKGPHSYTGEDTLEFSCHGSTFIQQRVLQQLQREGARMAEPGEYTLRAFLNGKLDLSQAEAVADLIAAEHASAHRSALQQLRGGYSTTIRHLRQQLIDFASLLELELDFAEEDVEFANRDHLKILVQTLLKEVRHLRQSFATGNALKQGIPVVIAGKPNVGKSTLLNALLNEEKAIVSEIAGTTRDVIEDHMIIEGLRFRFMDTAGIRITEDVIEKIGVERTFSNAGKASIVVYMIDPEKSDEVSVRAELIELKNKTGNDDYAVITVINKVDQHPAIEESSIYHEFPSPIFISAKQQIHLDELKTLLLHTAKQQFRSGDTEIVTNARHAEALSNAEEALTKVIEGMNHQLSTDLLALELKSALIHLGEITGEIYSDDLLGNIFSKFCIGK